MAIGPVDVYVIGFPGNKFSGQIVPAIMEQVEAGVIRVLDVLFVMKDAEGTVVTLAIEDLDADGAAFAELDIASPGALNDEDADEVADDLPLDSSALLIAYENIWMTNIVLAFAAAEAVVINQVRIPVDVVAAVIDAGRNRPSTNRTRYSHGSHAHGRPHRRRCRHRYRGLRTRRTQAEREVRRSGCRSAGCCGTRCSGSARRG